MNPGRHERDLLNRYLLGYLTEEERDQVASRVFAEDEFAEALEDAERDLLDDYARGSLNKGDRAAVSLRLLTAESQREKLRFAEALIRRRKGRKGLPVLRLLPWAAAVVLMLGAGWMWLRRPVTPEKSAAAPAVQQSSGAAQRPIPVFAALLAPGGVRDGEMQEVVAPAGAQLVRIDLQLEGTETPGNYSVQWFRQRERVFEEHAVSGHVEAGVPVLSVVVSPDVLTAGVHRISVTPMAPSGHPSEALSYYFRVR
jgi:hypothetical protein